MTPDTPIPSSQARPADLTDAEFDELDRLLDATPEPLEPLDAVMLDGFLCGTLVQPVAIEPDELLRWSLDEEGRPLPDDVDPVWRQRLTELVMKREAALRRAIVEDGGFDPMLVDPDAEPATETDDRDEDAPEDAGPPWTPIQQAVLPWVVGFARAVERFPALLDLDDDAVSFALARIFRHLPPEDDEQAEIAATLDREMPLADLDDAVLDLVDAVVELVELTEDERYRVQQVRRDAPKVGRNEPCPCGSGKKYKLCHGRG